MYPTSRYTTYEYEEEAVPHTSHDYYEMSDYPGKNIFFTLNSLISSVLFSEVSLWKSA